MLGQLRCFSGVPLLVACEVMKPSAGARGLAACGNLKVMFGMDIVKPFVLLPLFVAVVVYYIVVGAMARAKGQPFFGWVVFCTLLGPLALLVLALLPKDGQGMA